MRIVITGGQGDLGARVGRRLSEQGHEVVTASRRTGVDLRSGVGLAEVLERAYAVVHLATDPRRARAVDVGGARRLVAALSQLESPAPVVAISIVGCDRTPYGYYRAKWETEQLLESSGRPVTVLRTTQFHALAAFLPRLLGLGPVGLTVGHLAVQPVDIEWVASTLADLATGPAPIGYRRATDLAGPDVLTVPELDALVRAHTGRPPRRTVSMPAVGPLLRSLDQRGLVPDGPVETGGRTFEQWLAAQPGTLPRTYHDRS